MKQFFFRFLLLILFVVLIVSTTAFFLGREKYGELAFEVSFGINIFQFILLYIFSLEKKAQPKDCSEECKKEPSVKEFED
ncbi:MAG TPA: hypothetical protein DDY68_04045 [Porphyromonadaceae bacterium]|nr:hypothetical protein [Porphyromonadaceae bacterium]